MEAQATLLTMGCGNLAAIDASCRSFCKFQTRVDKLVNTIRGFRPAKGHVSVVKKGMSWAHQVLVPSTIDRSIDGHGIKHNLRLRPNPVKERRKASPALPPERLIWIVPRGSEQRAVACTMFYFAGQASKATATLISPSLEQHRRQGASKPTVVGCPPNVAAQQERVGGGTLTKSMQVPWGP
jgi:hypothetical protein